MTTKVKLTRAQRLAARRRRHRIMVHGPAALLNLLVLAVITFAYLEADVWITWGP